jgi:hypothetical protein
MPDTIAFAQVTRTEHTTVRLDFVVPEKFETFRSRFEASVPAFSPELLGAGDGWDAICERTMAAAPHGFLHYHRLDVLPVFSRNGHTTPCTTYLMGNHVLAEQMFRHDPAVLLYAPLRVAIYGGQDRCTHLAVDQPSTKFGSFSNPDIAAVGATLDERLVELLRHLGIIEFAGDAL